MARLLWLPLLFLLSILICACDGDDGTPPMPLTVTITQSPAGPQEEGTTVVFSVTVSGGTGPYTTTNWVFPTGSTTSFTAGTLSATATFGDPGNYAGSVDVLDAGVNTGSYPFNFEVDPRIPVVTGVTPTGNLGLPLETVALEAEIDGTADTITWDLGAGMEPNAATGQIVSVQLLSPGSYSGTVVAENSNGQSDPFGFSYSVQQPVAPAWSRVSLGAARTDFVGAAVSVVLHEGRLVALHNAPNGVWISHALVENPSSPADWRTYLLEADGICSGHQSLTSIAGTLAVVYMKGTNLRFAQSLSEVPEDQSDWAIYDLGSGSPPERGSCILSRGERLAVLWCGGPTFLRFAQSTGPSPATADDWSSHSISDSSGLPLSFVPLPAMMEIDGFIYATLTQVLDNQPSVALLLRAETEDPEESSDWSVSSVGSIGDAAQAVTDLINLNGVPAVVYNGGIPLNNALRLAIANSSTPTSEADFSHLTISDPFNESLGAAVVISRNRLAVAYIDTANQTAVIARAIGIDPSVGADWTRAVVDTMAGTAAIDTVDDDGQLVVAFLDMVSRKLRIARADGSF